MARDEVGTRRQFRYQLDTVIEPKITEFHGRIVKTMGDGLLVEFASAVDAVLCAAAFQNAVNGHNQDSENDDAIVFRVGINLGDVIVEDDDIHGDGVNVAARLEGLANPGGIVVSEIVKGIVQSKVDLEFEDLGLVDVKNIAERIRPYRIRYMADGGNDAGSEIAPAPPARPLHEGPSIVVLPFANNSGDCEQEYFADGITDDLITDLAQSSVLFVVSRNSAFAFKGAALDTQEIATRLGVGHVLEGSVRKAGDRIRINARLVDGKTGGQIWGERFQGQLSDIFELQDDISGRIRSALEGQLIGAPEQKASRARPRNSKAYDLCLRGRWEYYSYSPANLATAQHYFEQAVAEDGDYAEAYAYLSYCRTTAYVFTWPGADETLDPALDLARKAVDLDSGSALAHARLGWVLGFMGRFDEAVSSFEAAVIREPENAEALYAYGETMNRGGEPARALPILEKAFSVDEYFPPSWEFAKAHSFVLLKRFDDGLGILLPALARTPRLVPARVQLARAYGEMGRGTEAAAAVSEIRKSAPNYSLSSAARMFPYPTKVERDRLLNALRDAGLPD